MENFLHNGVDFPQVLKVRKPLAICGRFGAYFSLWCSVWITHISFVIIQIQIVGKLTRIARLSNQWIWFLQIHQSMYNRLDINL